MSAKLSEVNDKVATIEEEVGPLRSIRRMSDNKTVAVVAGALLLLLVRVVYVVVADPTAHERQLNSEYRALSQRRDLEDDKRWAEVDTFRATLELRLKSMEATSNENNLILRSVANAVGAPKPLSGGLR